MRRDTHLQYHFVKLFLVALHRAVLFDLHDGDVLLVAERNHLVECAHYLERHLNDSLLVIGRSILWDDLCEETQGVKIFKDVALFVGDQ